MSLGDQAVPSGNASTGIVVVFFRPDAACVRRANRYADAGLCVVVDNTEQLQSAEQLGLDTRILYVANAANLGIATAINQGVELLLKAGCTSALIFDQDSEPSRQLLEALPPLLDEEKRRRGRVAVIGPAYEDARLGGVAPFVRFGYLRLRRVAPVGTRPIEIDFLITSGSCINLAAWQEIGPMDDGLFIDFVDLEWCVRARARGYAVLGAPALRLVHELGGEPVRVLGRQYPSHSPLRHYYLFRNAVALIKRGYVPWTWKSTEIVKFPFRLAIYGLFLQPRLSHLKMALVGIWHGLRGRMGQLDQS
ncbi:glycosyltransferase family 2 protein [Burkholderia sp. Ac-20365]|uniref:glycosyltransferase family 2 protein n=1 Tax=Burkholderia sp. Ac-20365 TaxID=2703897 RepID=UPI00197BC813|nr:glycosyltransferase family 2 protein [Burkholderia sp. Ac-20365]MBN3763249.1 glycosyltransferase family 2 protein [Burkholderia sp. Ac-20365]